MRTGHKNLTFLLKTTHTVCKKYFTTEKNCKRNFRQSQIDLVDKDICCYEKIVLSFNFQKYHHINDNIQLRYSQMRKRMHINETLSTQSDFITHENNRKCRYTYEDLIGILMRNNAKISALRGIPTISYISDIHTTYDSHHISINEDDKKGFIDTISSLDASVDEVDIILHSRGGFTSSAREIVEILRGRFKKINFLVPYAAQSAASMICMAGDEIIMTPEGSLSPYDVQVLSPDNKTYLPASEMMQCIKEAKRSQSLLFFWIPRSLYDGWTGTTIRKTEAFTRQSMKINYLYPRLWLMKYMFKAYKGNDSVITKNIFLPVLINFTKKGWKAKKIVDSFISIGTRLSHDTPLMYNDLKNSGLKVNLANNELTPLLRETYIVADKIFERSNIAKIYCNQFDSFYYYNKKDEILVDKEAL